MTGAVDIRGRVTGFSKVKAKLDALDEVTRQALDRERLGSFLVRRMKERFMRGVDPDGNPWKQLDPKTRKGKGILRQTEELYKSIDVFDDAPSGRFAVSTGAGFRIGIKVRTRQEISRRGRVRTVNTSVYGRAHQQGLGHVPARRFIGIGATDVKAIADLIRREYKKVATG